MKRLLLATALSVAVLALPACANAVGSLARVTVFDRTANQELPVHWRNGRAYIAGHPGNEYQVRVRNAAGEDLLAVISVDGVNVVSGESAHTTQSGYVVGSYASLDVSGWRKNMARTAAFYFTALPNSYAARTRRPENVGVIGVALFRRKPQQPMVQEPRRPMPYSREESSDSARSAAPPAAADGAGRSKAQESTLGSVAPETPLGTGHGRNERNPAQWVEFERATPYPVEKITIYYDSVVNLVAQGVIRRPPQPRQPNPFPGFVPDPLS